MIKIHYINNGRYCSSRDLHKILELNHAHYARDVKKWVNSSYLFQGKAQLTKPVYNYDYLPMTENQYSPRMVSIENERVKGRNRVGNFSEEFMVRLELVKLVTLHGNSKVKDLFVQWLLSLDNMVESHELISQDMLFGLLELSRLCAYMDRQMQYYAEHKKTWQDIVEDNRFWEFDVWRNRVLDSSSAQTIREQYKKMSRIGNLGSKREQENSINPYKGIRDAIFDFIKVQYHQIDYYFPESTEKALTLANLTQRILEKAGGTPTIKPKGYVATGQIEIGKDCPDAEPDIELVSRVITMNILASVN